MTSNDRDAFWAIFCRLSMLFGKKPDAEMADEYFQALMDLPLVLVTDATVSLKKSSRFWPKPVDWREAKLQTGTHQEKASPLSDGCIPLTGIVWRRWSARSATTGDGDRNAAVRWRTSLGSAPHTAQAAARPPCR